MDDESCLQSNYRTSGTYSLRAPVRCVHRHHVHWDTMKENHYRHLATMATLSFAAMYTLMYAMADVIGNVFNSVNQVYMAGLMTAPMIIIGHAFLCMSERTRLFESREHHADRRSAGWIHQLGANLSASECSPRGG